MRLRARAKWVPKEAVDWEQRTELAERTTSSRECATGAGALSSLLVAFFAAFGLFFHYGELDFPLHVVNAVNDHANFVADGVGLL